eukprot:jgi/Mesvir1/16094/Mv08388-RA.1
MQTPQTVRLYDVDGVTLKSSYASKAPVLDCCFLDPFRALSCGLDCTVTCYDFERETAVRMGAHDAPIKCVEYVPLSGQVASAGWDRQLRAWDPRMGGQGGPLCNVVLPGKAYTMSCCGDKLVLGCSGRSVLLFDVRRLAAGPVQQRESSLKYQTRCIRCFPDGAGYALSSVEGRVAMEYFDPSPDWQKRKYAFKCHRSQEAGRDIVFPVNAIAFHPRFGTFATGGCDGYISVWDGANRKRLYQYMRYPTSIAALAFSHDGSRLAVAASYTFEEGEKEHAPDRIYVRIVNDAEVRPKPRTG